jgi:hypothetical protein
MNPYTDGELETFGLLQTAIEVSHGNKNSQTSPYRSLGIIFMCLRIAKIDQETISQELSGVTFIACDDLRTDCLVGSYDVPIVFWIKEAGELGRLHQVAEHDCELTAFRFGGMRGRRRRCDLCREVLLRDDLLHRWWRG